MYHLKPTVRATVNTPTTKTMPATPFGAAGTLIPNGSGWRYLMIQTVMPTFTRG